MANEIFGTEFDDSGATALHGTMGDDIIFGLGGNDEIYGGSGINIYIGGAGDDNFFGATFADRENHDIADYSGAAGPIYVFLATEGGYVSGDASVGYDELSFIDRIVGTAFDDTFDVGNTDGIQAHIDGGAGDDTINGNQWNTVVRYTSAAAGVTVDLQAGTAHSTEPGDAAGIGVDELNFISEVRGSDHGDSLSGSDTFSTETFRGRGGADIIDGRGGWDKADYSNTASGITVNLGLNGLGNGVASDDGDGASDILLNIEDVRGSDYADHITGDDGDNEILGRGDADTIDGAGGDDELIGGGGNDHLIGGAGIDGLEGENGNDILEGGTGINFLGGGSGTDTGIFAGNRADYQIYQQIGSPFAEIVLIDTRTGLPEETIHFTSSIENFSFTDGVLNAPSLGAEFNTTPEAASDLFMVRPGDIVTYNILANDFDADGDVLRLVDLNIWDSTETPITWDEFGNITFVVPEAAPFAGSFVFFANVWDAKGGLAESTVTFQFATNQNSPPTANPDTYPTPATNNLLFLGFTPESGPEFFRLGNDGTLNQVTSSGLTGGSSQAVPVLFGNALYFMAVDPVTGKEQVWRGIDGEIELVTRLNNAGNGITVENFIEFDGGLYFYAAQAPSGTPSEFSGGIFRIGESGAVSQITNPTAGDPNFFYQPVILGGNLVFGGGTEASGPQWWSIDGSGNVAQLSPGTAADSGLPISEAQIVYNGELYWHEHNLLNDTNDVLKIDASGNVTVVAAFDSESTVTRFAEFGGNLYFHVNDDDPAVEGDHAGLYKLSGSTVTRLTVESVPGSFVGFFFPTEINGTLYYGAFNPGTLDEAWYSISGPAGETVTEIAAGPWPKVVGTGDAILLHEDKIYWNAVDEFGNAQVWVFDPVVGEDVIVSNVNPENGGIAVDRFYSFDGEVYFSVTGENAIGIYKISDAGVVTQVVDSNQFGQPFGFFFPMIVGPDEPVVEGQFVTLDVLANDTDPDGQIDHGQSFVLVDVEVTSVEGPIGVALGTGTASIVDNKLFFNQGNDFVGLADGQSATVTISYTMRDTNGATASSYAEVTITGSGAVTPPILGTPDGETIPGTPGNDVILADAGNDTIIGNGGNDFIDGGEGTDTAVIARQFLDGNGYAVFLNPNGTVVIDSEGTTIDDGSVTLVGIEQVNFGGTIYNLILGDDGDNALASTLDRDIILGGAGNDTIQGGAHDLMSGGDGNGDTLSYAATTLGVTASLESGEATGGDIGNNYFGGFENLIGGSGNDTLTGDGSDNEITGGGGNDTIDGGGGGAPFDIVYYSGDRTDYLVTAGAPGWISIVDLRIDSPDGTDTVTNVEVFDFNGQTFQLGDLVDLGGELEAVEDIGSAGENEYKLFNVLANDSAPSGGTLTLNGYTVSSVISDNFAINGMPVGGILGIVAGQIEFNPGALFDQLTGTQSATITLEYTVADGLGGFATAPLVININGENDLPAVINSSAAGGEDDFFIPLDLQIFDADHPFDPVTIEIVSQTGPGIATPLAGGDSFIDFQAAGFFDALAEGEQDVVTLTYRVIDAGGGVSDDAEITITIFGANDTPITESDYATAVAGEETTIDVLANDVDPDTNDTLTIVSAFSPNATITIENGLLSYTANAGFSGQDMISYTIEDSNGAINFANVFVTVEGGNQNPVAVADVAEVLGSTPIDIDVLANDTDPDTNDVLTVISASAMNGTVSIGAGGVLTYTAAPTFTGIDNITYEISDGHGGVAMSSVTVNVTSDNQPPTVADVSLTVLENQGSSTGLLGSDENVPLLNFNLVSPVMGASIAGNIVNFFAGQEFDYLAAGESVEIIFAYTATDQQGLTSAPANITVTVVGQNDMPLLPPISMPVVNENTATAFLTVAATDFDTSDILTYAIAGGVDAAFFQIDSTTGALAFVTPPDFEAFADSDGDNLYIVDISVTDGTDTAVATVFTQVADLAGVNRSGTTGDDSLAGTVEKDTLSGLAGNDDLTGFAGDDVLSGHGGDDTIDGGDGDDILNGGLGADIIFGGSGNDVIRFGATEAIGETIDGGDGNDTIEVTGSGAVRLTDFNAMSSSVEQWIGNGAGITGGSENNTFILAGLSGAETIGIVDGGAGDDVIVGTLAGDNLRGGIGNDQIAGGAGNDTIAGGTGADTTTGGEGDDTFVVAGTDAATDTFDGGEGNDTIAVTGAGNVTLSNFDAQASGIEGWSGNNAGINGTAANDRINLTGLSSVAGLTFVDGSTGNDEITGSMFADDLRGGAGDDQLTGGSGLDTITGGSGADTTSGGEGDDTFVISGTDAAADTLDGGEGTDNISISGATNVTLSTFDAAASSIEVWSGNNAGIFGTIANDRINLSGLTAVSGLAFIDGSSGNDELTGSTFADDLRGGAGDDTLIGGRGDDLLTGNAGADSMQGGDGNDRFVVAGSDALTDSFDGGDGIDSVDVTGTAALRLTSIHTAASSIEVWNGNGAGILGSSGGDILDFSGITVAANNMGAINGGVGDDILIGSSFDDVLIGASQNDTLIGGDGNDILHGGAGFDTVSGGAGNDTIIVERNFDLSDTINGGDGIDTLQVAGTLNVTLNGFDTTTNGVEIWQGNNTALLGSGGANTFNLSGLTAVSGLSYVDGASGHDTIVGSAFADDLRGGAGNDQVAGGGGIDIINGGTGNDILEGGAGDDLFVFNASWGRDQITDFEAGDQIVFSGVSGLDDFGDIAQSIVSGNVQIAFGTNSIALVGHTTFLTADDVTFS